MQLMGENKIRISRIKRCLPIISHIISHINRGKYANENQENVAVGKKARLLVQAKVGISKFKRNVLWGHGLHVGGVWWSMDVQLKTKREQWLLISHVR